MRRPTDTVGTVGCDRAARLERGAARAASPTLATSAAVIATSAAFVRTFAAGSARRRQAAAATGCRAGVASAARARAARRRARRTGATTSATTDRKSAAGAIEATGRGRTGPTGAGAPLPEALPPEDVPWPQFGKEGWGLMQVVDSQATAITRTPATPSARTSGRPKRPGQRGTTCFTKVRL